MIIRALWKLAMRRAEKEFRRYHETWNPPYSLLGCGVFFGLIGALFAQLLTMIIVTVIAWEYHDRPEFGLVVVTGAFQFGALPGFFLGFTTGMSQAWVWLRFLKPAGGLAVLGGLIVAVRIGMFITRQPGWEDYLPTLLMLYSVALLWSARLVLHGLYLLSVRPAEPKKP